MAMFPIVDRELRVAARRGGTYWSRALVPLASVWVAVGTLMFLEASGVPATLHGPYLFRTLIVVGYVFSFLVGIRATSDCVSQERREGTLGLLFLTDLNGRDVVLGKLAASSLNAIYGLLASLPVLALPLQLGGVTFSEFVSTAVALFVVTLFSLSSGLCVSSFNEQERTAMSGTVLFLIVTTVVPPTVTFGLDVYLHRGLTEGLATAILATCPWYPLGYLVLEAWPARFGVPAFSFWWSLILLAAAGVVMLHWASRRVLWIWREGVGPLHPVVERWRTRLRQGIGAAPKRLSRASLLDRHPCLWLAQRDDTKRRLVWMFLAAMLVVWAAGWLQDRETMFTWQVAVPTVLMVQFVLKVWVVSEAALRVAEDRRTGGLELLLCTPLGAEQIVYGQWLAAWHQFARPFGLLFALEFLLVGQVAGWAAAAVVIVVWTADMAAVHTVGLWLGLTRVHTARAILAAVAWVLVLPGLVAWAVYWVLANVVEGPMGSPRGLSLPIYVWGGIGLAADALLGYVWAGLRLRKHFQQVVTGDWPERRGFARAR